MAEQEMQTSVEQELLQLPIVQYAWLKIQDVTFSERVRTICRQECPRYGKSWACPPGVGSVQQCQERCGRYDGLFVFTTIAEVQDITNMEETLATRGGHEEVTRQLQKLFGECGLETLALSGDSCAICPECAYPEQPCRFPDRMIPCIEGYGIVTPLLAEKAGIVFDNGGNLVTWFGLLFYRAR